MTLGQRLKKIRNEMKLTQNEFAEKLGIHPKQFAKYESDRTIPVIGVIEKISKFCEVSADFIICGEDQVLAKRTKINDTELIDYFQRVNKLKKSDRDKVKWVIKSLLDAS